MKIRLYDYWNERYYYLGIVEVANEEEAKHLTDLVNALEDEKYGWEEVDDPMSYSDAIRELKQNIPDRITQFEEEKQHREEDIEFLTNIMKGETE